MLRSIAFAAAAAYLTFSLPDGISAVDLHDNDASSPPAHERGVKSGEEQQPTQLEAPRPAASTARSVSWPSLASLASGGVSRLQKLVERFKFPWEKEDPYAGRTVKETRKGLRRGIWYPHLSLAENNERYILAYAYPREPDPPVTRGPEEIQSRIKYIEDVLGWIKEAENSDVSLDSTGGDLSSRLRQAYDWRAENKNAGFSADVKVEDIVKFKQLIEITEETLERHGRMPHLDD